MQNQSRNGNFLHTTFTILHRIFTDPLNWKPIFGKALITKLCQAWNMYELLKESPSLIATRFNAHLTFNVLNTLQGLLLEKDPDTAIELISCYSRILRKMLINGRTETTVKEELDVIRDYLEIEKISKDNGFIYSIEVDASVKALTIPKSLLISIVENAVKHGARKLQGKGWIRITGFKELNSRGKSTQRRIISIRNLAPVKVNGFDIPKESYHGNDLLHELVEDFENKTGRKVAIEFKENGVGDHLAEVEVLVSIG